MPPLNALLALEAIARHQSFTRGASELNITQTAISHRIKELESLLGIQLFTRKQNVTKLTNEGRIYLECVRPAIAQIAAATESVSSVHDNRLTIACLFAFSAKCLTPALPEFLAMNPNIELRLMPLAPTDRLEQCDFDVAIWHGIDDWPDFDAQKIADEDIFPVCTPALFSSGPPLRIPDDLRHYPIVRTASPIITDDWTVWLRESNSEVDTFASEVHCGTLAFAMNAIIEGLGVGIGRSMLVGKDLESGRLVEPFTFRYRSPAGYHVLSRPERSALPKVQKFKRWLLAHFAQTVPTTPIVAGPGLHEPFSWD
ncbi:LysR substrate-binding domain-containing protein [Ottowia thiooxydans]|uniref:LysR substrate-binding domain-containing protein n=1 Tax=Ottowia thiooxydans TaxID=219182 RepID=UPI0003F74AA7|nr:LysR substrate-binding domain-containing protein [Ottowia thiooxydans]